MIEKKVFGRLSDGTQVNLYTIKNKFGEYVELLDYGATLHSIFVRDGDGKLGDVLLGTDKAKELGLGAFEGSTIGRCANRIANGRYEINGRTIHLECNHHGHFIHGASGNYATKMFIAEADDKDGRVIFRFSDVGEGGFDCEVDVQVSYSFNDGHELGIEYELLPYGETILCPTNHAFFNLSGGDIRSHLMKIYSDEIAVKGSYGVPTGEVQKAKDTHLDFRSLKKIGEALCSQKTLSAEGYDDYFILNKENYGLSAEVISQESERIMQVFTDMPAVIVFTPVLKQPKAGKGGAVYEGYCAVCLETQYVPNAINCPQFDSPFFEKGEKLVSKTVYAFDVFKNKQ